MKNILTNAELQIIFESNAYLPPNFLLNADFQNVKLYFHPLYFFAMHKREGITVLKRISVVCYCLWYIYYIANICFCNTTHYNAKETIDNMSTNRWTSSIRSFNFANQYALHWTPNAYRDILMRIFTPCLFFQCVFTNFQCVITLLRALSVALPTTARLM